MWEGFEQSGVDALTQAGVENIVLSEAEAAKFDAANEAVVQRWIDEVTARASTAPRWSHRPVQRLLPPHPRTDTSHRKGGVPFFRPDTLGGVEQWPPHWGDWPICLPCLVG